jgi:hypothetical protein
MTEDLHSPTTAGPEPTPAVDATTGRPAGSPGNGVALPGPLANLPVDEHPEILVGAAFAGGVVAAFVLRRLGR